MYHTQYSCRIKFVCVYHVRNIPFGLDLCALYISSANTVRFACVVEAQRMKGILVVVTRAMLMPRDIWQTWANNLEVLLLGYTQNRRRQRKEKTHLPRHEVRP